MADPNALIAQGIANLTKLFAPPSGQDYYAWQRAGALRGEQERLKSGRAEILRIYGPEAAAVFDAAGAQGLGLHPKLDLYRRSTVPGTTPQSLDTSAYAVHGNADNTFTGLGIREGGLDRRNTADNARAMSVARLQDAGMDRRNTADNARAVDVALLAPVAKDAVRYVPPSIATSRDIPQVVTGIREYDQGKNYDVPGATPGTYAPVQGPRKPLTMTEYQAEVLSNLPPADQRRVATQGVPTTEVVGPDGKPRVTFRDDAARAGATPYDKANPGSFKPVLVLLPDGSSATGVFNNQTGATTLQDGSPIPPGARVVQANIQASDPNALRPSVEATRQQRSIDLNMLEGTSRQLRTLVSQNPGAQGVLGSLRGTVQDVIAAGGEIGPLLDASRRELFAAAQRDSQLLQTLQAGKVFDPAIPAIQMVEYMLAAQLAKSLDPNGRISNQNMEQALAMVGAGRMLGNAQRTTAVLDQIDRIIAEQRRILGAGTATPAAPAPAAAPAGTVNPPQTPAAPAGAPPLPPGFRVVP